jgi:uncharacterized protein YggT (Ycf19 family)
MITTIIYLLFGIAEFLIGFRFLFELLGANPNSAVVTWIYNWSQPLVAPFAGIFGQHTAGQGVAAQSVFDWTALIALVVYGVVGTLLTRILAHTHHHDVV